MPEYFPSFPSDPLPFFPPASPTGSIQTDDSRFPALRAPRPISARPGLVLRRSSIDAPGCQCGPLAPRAESGSRSEPTTSRTCRFRIDAALVHSSPPKPHRILLTLTTHLHSSPYPVAPQSTALRGPISNGFWRPKPIGHKTSIMSIGATVTPFLIHAEGGKLGYLVFFKGGTRLRTLLRASGTDCEIIHTNRSR